MKDTIILSAIIGACICFMWFLIHIIPNDVKCIDGKLYNHVSGYVYTLSTLKDPSCVEVK